METRVLICCAAIGILGSASLIAHTQPVTARSDLPVVTELPPVTFPVPADQSDLPLAPDPLEVPPPTQHVPNTIHNAGVCGNPQPYDGIGVNLPMLVDPSQRIQLNIEFESDKAERLVEEYREFRRTCVSPNTLLKDWRKPPPKPKIPGYIEAPEDDNKYIPPLEELIVVVMPPDPIMVPGPLPNVGLGTGSCVYPNGVVVSGLWLPRTSAARGNMTPAAQPAPNQPPAPAEGITPSPMYCPPGSVPMKRTAPTTASLDHAVPKPAVATHVVPVPPSVPTATVHMPPQASVHVAPSAVHTPPQPPTYIPPKTVHVPPQAPVNVPPAPVVIHAPPVYTGPAVVHVSPGHTPGPHKPGTHVGKPPKKHPPQAGTHPPKVKSTGSSKPPKKVSVVHQGKPNIVRYASPGGRPASVSKPQPTIRHANPGGRPAWVSKPRTR